MEFHPSMWPAEFVCPISRTVMVDPVVVSSGHTYERICIESWLDLGQTRCVRDNTLLNCNFIVPNIALRGTILNLIRSKGMRALPSPPSPSLARALAKHLISELQASNHTAHTSEFSEEDATYISKQVDSCKKQAQGLTNQVYEEREVSMVNPDQELVKSFRKVQMEGESDDIHRIGIMDTSHEQTWEFQKGSSGSYSVDCPHRNTAARGDTDWHRQSDNLGLRVSRDQRAGSHDDYNRYTAATRGDAGLAHGQSDHVEGIRVSREQGGCSHDVYSRYNRAGGLHDGSRHTRANGYRTALISNRYMHSASGEVLLETSHGQGELPPPLVTKPSSYSSTEGSSSPIASSSLSSTMISLVKKLQDPMPESHEAAVIELRRLTRMSAENCAFLCCPDLIHALLPHLKSQSSVVQINAVAALVNLSLEKQNKVMIVRSGAVPPLVELIKRGFSEAQEHAAGAIFSLALADENKDPIGVLNTIPPLVHLLHSGPPRSRQDAAMALYHLSLFQTNRSKLVKVGAVPILLTLAESTERPDLASRALLILCNVAAVPEGRETLLEHNGITTLVDLLAVGSNKQVPEQAAAVLLLLSKGNRRFKTMASSAGAQELLTVLADVGTPRAREKALALLAIMKESTSGQDDTETDTVLSRQYLRRNKGRLDGIHMNSSAF